MSTSASSLILETRPWFRSIDKRLLLAIGCTLLVAFTFWLGSRVPNLNEKAMMGGDAELDSLGFDIVLEVQESDPFMVKVIYTTVNWIDTNKRGMAFGLLLASCLMTALALFQTRSFKNGFANAAMGAVIGTPLGVCVNCAAPIAKGLHAAGTRLETTLATMISSPTMNVIVLTMLFSLFPWYMVVTKLGITAAFILIGIPIMSRLLFSQEQLEKMTQQPLPGEDGQTCELPLGNTGQSCDIMFGNTWRESSVWFGKTITRNLWYIVRTTVPFMFLAGFLGSLAIIALPWETMSQILPDGVGAVRALAIMGFISMVGIFLPVPIAFDVIVVAVLLASGMPVKYAMVLLFTLGIFSVYSFSIIWQYISRRVAVLMYVGLMALGVFAGVVGHYASIWDEARQRAVMFSVFYEGFTPAERPDYSIDRGLDDAALVANLRSSSVKPQAVDVGNQPGIEVSRVAFKSSTDGSTEFFRRVEGDELGIDEVSPFSLLRHLPPRYWGRGIATGDVHNDGWPDVLMAADNLTIKGISLYANQQGASFVKQRVDVPELDELEIVNAALADINNDGWLDIFVTSYRRGNYLVYNQNGHFTSEGFHTLPDTGSVLSAAVSFGDVDEDGDLDIVLGNWSLGYLRGIVNGEPATAKNFLLVQNDGEFEVRPLDQYPGETLSTLLTDMNDDGHLDLIIGNDFQASDVYYFGDGTGAFEEIYASTALIPHTTTSTMSIASADIDNDLVPELFLAQITTGEGANFAEQMVTSDHVCGEGQDKSSMTRCLYNMGLNSDVNESRARRDTMRCVEIEDAATKEDCVALHVIWSAWMLEDPNLCEQLPEQRADLRSTCRDMFGSFLQASGADAEKEIPQQNWRNVLLAGSGKEPYTDIAKDMGLTLSGWAWNAKFADVDNDEYQDIYVANGLFYKGNRESNFFFHNDQGTAFKDRTTEFGLTDFRATSSYSYVDFDRDGDLDIISIPVNGPVRVYINETRDGHSVIVDLRDEVGNRFGINSKIIITYGEAGSRQQIREIQSGGGFLSFDEPAAHFGLAGHDVIDRIEVRWTIGPATIIEGPLEIDARYTITRTAPGAVTAAD